MVNMAVRKNYRIHLKRIKTKMGIDLIKFFPMALKQAAVNNYPLSLKFNQMH